jgi:hypothetical protein
MIIPLYNGVSHASVFENLNRLAATMQGGTAKSQTLHLTDFPGVEAPPTGWAADDASVHSQPW